MVERFINDNYEDDIWKLLASNSLQSFSPLNYCCRAGFLRGPSRGTTARAVPARPRGRGHLPPRLRLASLFGDQCAFLYPGCRNHRRKLGGLCAGACRGNSPALDGPRVGCQRPYESGLRHGGSAPLLFRPSLFERVNSRWNRTRRAGTPGRPSRKQRRGFGSGLFASSQRGWELIAIARLQRFQPGATLVRANCLAGPPEPSSPHIS